PTGFRDIQKRLTTQANMKTQNDQSQQLSSKLTNILPKPQHKIYICIYITLSANLNRIRISYKTKPTELFLHLRRQNYRQSRLRGQLVPEVTGVRTGISRVNS